jgi:hypothetical protein
VSFGIAQFGNYQPIDSNILNILSILGRQRPEPVAARTSAQFYLVDIALIYGKNLADCRPAGVVNQAGFPICQHGAGKEKIAADAALTAGPLADKDLSEHIFLAQLNEIPPPEFAGHVSHRT